MFESKAYEAPTQSCIPSSRGGGRVFPAVFPLSLRSRGRERSDGGVPVPRLSHYPKAPDIDFSRIRAHMLAENLPIGMAFNQGSFDNSGVYAEFAVNGGISFHIYPKMNNIDWAPQEERAIMHDEKQDKSLKYAHAKYA